MKGKIFTTRTTDEPPRNNSFQKLSIWL